MTATYQAALPIAHLGIEVADVCGLAATVAVDATVGDVTYRVVNTHLEAFNQLPRVAQMDKELVASLSDVTLPVILLGDFNTAAPDGAAYQLLVGAGYADVWQADSEGTGNTCCQDADLMNEESDLRKRIDQVFIKGVSLREGAAIRTGHRRRPSRGQDTWRPLAIGPRGGGRAPAGRVARAAHAAASDRDRPPLR